jgi:membrane protein YqaA with SNARE-associated domain
MSYLNDNYGHLIRIVLIILVVILAFWASGVVKDSDFVTDLVRKFGYGGIFLVAVVSGFNLAIPIPAISFLPVFLASGLNALAVVVVMAAGMTLADFIGYLLGKTSRHIVLSAFERKVVSKFDRFREKLNWSPALVLFLFASFVPIPNEIILIPMAFLGYRLTYMLLPVFLGNIIFNSIYAIGTINVLKLIS